MKIVEQIKEFMQTTSKEVKFLALALIGFLFLIFDQHIVVGFLNGIYPAFQESYDVGTEFQLYTLHYMYGMSADIYKASDGYMSMINLAYNIRIDIFSDLLGYFMIMFAMFRLKHKTKIFNIAGMTAGIAAVLQVLIVLLPFVLNGSTLTRVCFWLALAEVGLDICIGYVFVYGICDLLSGYQYVRDRRAIGISWFVAVILNVVVVLLSWLSIVISPALLTFYNMFDLTINLLFVYFVYHNRHYIMGEKQA